MRNKDEDAMYGLLIPWIFFVGICGIMIILIILDAIFGLGML